MMCIFVTSIDAVYKTPSDCKISDKATVVAVSVRKTLQPIEHDAKPFSANRARSLSVQPRSLPIAA